MSDQPRHPMLARLHRLAGEWTMEATVGGVSMGRARATFVPRGDGSFLGQRVEGEATESASPEWQANAPFPTTAIIGFDDLDDRLCMLYADARGVHRLYEMSLTDTEWRVWRAAPGFHQRFTATISEDTTTITGAWEGSRDGEAWAHDFDVVYTRVA